MITKLNYFLNENIKYKTETDEDGDVTKIVAYDNGKEIGHSICEIYGDDMIEYFCLDYIDYDEFMDVLGNPNYVLYLESLKVIDEYKGKHISTILMDKTIELAKKLNAPYILINASPMDNRSIFNLSQIYKHWGFIEYKMDVKNCIMYLPIN